MFLVSDLFTFCFQMVHFKTFNWFTHFCREIFMSRFTHFFRRFFGTEKRTPQNESLLKCMQSSRPKTPKAFLSDALHVICETDPWDSTDQLELICPSHSEPHSISGWSFILEEMEAALQTAEQSIRSVFGVYSMCSFLGVLMMKTYMFQRFMKTYFSGR